MNDIVSTNPKIIIPMATAASSTNAGGGGGKLVWPVLRVALNLEKSTLWRAIRNFPRNYSRHYCSEDSSREQTEVLNWLANKNSFKVPFCMANGYYRRLVTITPKG